MQNLPFHIELDSASESLQLMKLKNGSFHIWKGTDSGILISGPGYILVKDPLLSFLRAYCQLDASFKECQVMQSVSGFTVIGYCEVSPYQEVTLENIEFQDVMAISIWHYNRSSLFLSPGVCQLLNNQEWANGLKINPGFSQFAMGNPGKRD